MTPRKTFTLRNLVINEVSLVDSPACPGAVVILAKRREEASQQEIVMPTNMAEVSKQRDETLIRIAKVYALDGVRSTFPELTAADFYQVIKNRGEATRQPGESPQTASVRYMTKTADGRTLRQAMTAAPGADHWATPPAAPMRDDPRSAGPASREIHDRASAMVANESDGGATTPQTRAAHHARARTKVRMMHPTLAAAERQEQNRQASA